MRTIVEDLNYAAQEPSSQAAAQAQRLGLSYVGFGRYEDPRTNQVTHVVQNGQLVPFNRVVKTNSYKTNPPDDVNAFMSSLSPEVQEVDQLLTAAYGPKNYDRTEIDAIQQFSTQSYSDVNDVLSQLPAGISVNKIPPMSPDDNSAMIVAALDSAMKKSRSPIDFITYTKIGDNKDNPDLVPGAQFKFKGFRNTSINLANVVTPEDDRSTVLQIRIRKNSRGIYTSNYSQNPEEAEFILPRGAKLEIISGPTKLSGSDMQVGNLYKEIYYYDCVSKS